MFTLREFLLVLVAVCGSIDCLMMTLKVNERRCLKEEIHKGVLVTGEYELTDSMGQIHNSLLVTDTKGHTLVSRDRIDKGKFAFTTDDYDVFEICFTSKAQPGAVQAQAQEVSLNMKHGVEARSYEALGEAAKLKPLELELRRLEDLSNAIVQDFAFMRQREEEMRNTNESTNSRVLYLSIFSMCCLLVLATWQVLYLRRFFKAKKLIE